MTTHNHETPKGKLIPVEDCKCQHNVNAPLNILGGNYGVLQVAQLAEGRLSVVLSCGDGIASTTLSRVGFRQLVMGLALMDGEFAELVGYLMQSRRFAGVVR